MSWLPIIVLAALVFGLAVVLLKLPRSLWMLFGSALLFGLAGYALQGHPGQAGAPCRCLHPARPARPGGEFPAQCGGGEPE